MIDTIAHPTVYERELGPHDTGLLDAHGNRIMRDPARRRIGYLEFPT